jgi:hypothetical protein
VSNNGSPPDLTPSEINRIAFDVLGDLPEPTPIDSTQKGPLGILPALRAKRGPSKADPRDAERLLVDFRECVGRGRPVPPRLMEHVSNAICAYVDGDRPSLDAAFGVLRSGAGRPPNDTGERIRIAAEFLALRIDGLTYEKAIKKSGYPRNTVTKVWRAHKLDALTSLLRDRVAVGRSWTGEEKSRLRNIFKATDGIIAPEGW